MVNYYIMGMELLQFNYQYYSIQTDSLPTKHTTMKSKLFLIFISILAFCSAQCQTASYSSVFGNCMKFTSANSNYINCTNHSSIQLTGAFTIEAWINPSTAAEMSIIEKYTAPCTGGYALRMNSSRKIVAFSLSSSNVCTPLTSVASIPLHQWTHVAVSFNAGTLRIYINGILDATLTGQGTPNTSTNFLTIGRRGDNSAALYFNGFIDEVRIWNTQRTASNIVSTMNSQLVGNESNLVAYYTFNTTGQGSGMTVVNNSTSAQSGAAAVNGSTFGSASTPQYVVTGSSLAFDGVNDVINIPQSSSMNPTNQLTLEAWIYLNNTSHQAIIHNWAPNNQYSLEIFNNEAYFVISTNTGVLGLGSGTTFPINQWVHLVAVYNGSSMHIYENGVLKSSTTKTGNIASNGTSGFLTIGNRDDGGSGPLNGKLDEIRIWHRALTMAEINANMNCEIHGSSNGLIMNYHFNQGANNSTNTEVNTLADAGGNTINGTLSNFSLTGTSSNWTNGSMLLNGISCLGQALDFDGTDDFIQVNNNIISANNITIDAWVKPALRTDGSSFSQFPNNVISSDLPGGYGHGFGANIVAGSSGLCIEANDAFRYISAALTADTWYHIVCVYTTGNVKTYLNGNLIDDFSFVQGFIEPNNYMFIGKHNDDGAYGTRRFFKGVIDELRIWSKALTATEVADTYLCTVPTSATNLIANYHFNQGIGGAANTSITTLADVSGNGFNGTLTNFAASGSISNWVNDAAPLAGNCVFCSNNSGATSVTACGSYSWNNTSYTSSGTYSATFTNVNGCDSVHTLNLTINPNPTLCSASSNPANFCQGSQVGLSYVGCVTGTQVGFYGAYDPSKWINNNGFNLGSSLFAYPYAGGYYNIGCATNPPSSPSTPAYASISIPITANGTISFQLTVTSDVYSLANCQLAYYPLSSTSFQYKINQGSYVSVSYFAPNPTIEPLSANVNVSIPVQSGDTLTFLAGSSYGSPSFSISYFSGPYSTQSITWYDAASGGNILGTGHSINVTPTASYQNYYAQVEDPTNGCINPIRVITQVGTMNQIPLGTAAIGLANFFQVCSGDLVGLSYTIPPNEMQSISWYNAPIGGNLIGTGNFYSFNHEIGPSGENLQYFAEVHDLLSGCISATRVATQSILMYPRPSLTAITASPDTVCLGSTLSLSATTSPGNQIIWYEYPFGIGIGPNIMHTPSTTGTKTYYARAINILTGCLSLFMPTNLVDVYDCNYNLQLTVFLEGYYMGNGQMQAALYNQGISTNPNEVDSVTVRLHKSNNYNEIVGSYTGIVNTNGQILCDYAGVLPGEYWVSIKNRNHIETVSSTALNFTGQSTLSVYLNNSANSYGGNMKQMGSNISAIFSGDIDQNGYLELDDYNLWDIEYQLGYPHTDYTPDLDGNGYVELDDYNLWDVNYQNGVFAIIP